MRRARRAEKPRQHTLGICQRLLGCHHSGEPRHACDRFAAYCEQRSAVKFAARGVLAAELLEVLLHIGQLFGSRDQLLQLPDPRRLPLQGGGQPLLFGTLVSSGGLPQRDEAARRGDMAQELERRREEKENAFRFAEIAGFFFFPFTNKINSRRHHHGARAGQTDTGRDRCPLRQPAKRGVASDVAPARPALRLRETRELPEWSSKHPQHKTTL